MTAIPHFLTGDPRLYAGFIQLFRRGTAQVVAEDEQGLFLRDRKGGAYMLAAADRELAASWLEKSKPLDCRLIMTVGDELADLAQACFGLTQRLEVYQAVYEHDCPPPRSGQLAISPAAPSDLGFIRRHYASLDEGELERIVSGGELFLARDRAGQRVGFIGQHLEGSMGLLEILPPFRRRGFGAELERFLIGRMLDQGLIPYCQFETDNLPSSLLQEKLGLSIAEEKIVWLF